MKRREITERMQKAAAEVYPPREARSVALFLAEELYGLTRTAILSEPDAAVDSFDDEEFGRVLKWIAAAMPVQYITGSCEFCGLKFAVARGVLIPRPETEELVRWIVAETASLPSPVILDVGTGSGAIAVALAVSLPGATVDAVDISPQALAMATDNARSNMVKVHFAHADILQPLLAVRQALPHPGYDLIVSNPPYIPASERAAMRENVTEYEPHQALFVPDDDPLLFYREIAHKATSLLHPGGTLWFEVHENHAGDVCRMLTAMGYADVECRVDMNDKPRMVRCRRR